MTVIDACIRHHWADQTELTKYMSAGWQEFLGRPGRLPDGGGAMPIEPGVRYANPGGDYRADAWPEQGPPGSDPACLAAALPDGVERAVLSYGRALYTSVLPNHYLGAEIARAANDWTIDRWLDGGDQRFHALALVANQLPEEAAKEIRRVGAHPRMVGVALGGNGIGRAFGHPLYHPIYAAAADLGLPVVLHAGSDGSPDAPSPTAAGGVPTSYAEYRVLTVQPLMTHLTTLITQGVFEKYPSLRVLIAGAGVLWLPSLFWRLDTVYKSLRREAPWLRRFPSEYLREHVCVTTHRMDCAPSRAQLEQALRAFGELEHVMCFGSGYPEWDADDAAAVAAVVPEAWRDRVMHGNAERLFGWADAPSREPVAAAREESAP